MRPHCAATEVSAAGNSGIATLAIQSLQKLTMGKITKDLLENETSRTLIADTHYHHPCLSQWEISKTAVGDQRGRPPAKHKKVDASGVLPRKTYIYVVTKT